jgi:hypothetical protein
MSSSVGCYGKGTVLFRGSGAMWQAEFKGLEIDACPFANLPEKKRTQWALQTDCPACATAFLGGMRKSPGLEEQRTHEPNYATR